MNQTGGVDMMQPKRCCSWTQLFIVLLLANLIMPAGFAETKPEGGDDPSEQLVLFSFKKPSPIIDGELTDESWKGAQAAVGFIVLANQEASAYATRVKSCYDENHLYIGAELEEPDVDQLQVNKTDPWRGDCLELFLGIDSDGEKYYHLVVDSAGNVFVGAPHDGGQSIAEVVRVAIASSASGWSIELAIPFEALGVTMPKDNARWRFNVARERYAGGPTEISSWAALRTFAERSQYGELAFYSRQEVEAIMAYWTDSDADPLMRRLVVSGFAIAQSRNEAGRDLSLWHYDPFAADREKNAEWFCAGLMGGGNTGYHSAEEKYPEFYQAAMGINTLMVNKSYFDEGLRQLRKVVGYGAFGASASPAQALAELDRASAEIDATLNDIYQVYGAAFNNGLVKAQLNGIHQRLEELGGRIEQTDTQLKDALAAAVALQQSKRGWQARDLTMSDSEDRTDEHGRSDRIEHSGMRFNGHEAPMKLLGEFVSINIDWPHVVADMHGPGHYTYPRADAFLENMKAEGVPPRMNTQALFGSQHFMPLAPWIKEAAEDDPDIYLHSQDGHVAKRHPTFDFVHMGVNPDHPLVQAFMEDYLTHLGEYLADKAHFVVTGGEDLNIIQPLPDGATFRSIGYNESNKANFRAYLRNRYDSIGDLNDTWGATYPSFDAVEPPGDKYIEPAATPSPLLYEFERWNRWHHVRYNVQQRAFLKRGACPS